MGNVQTRAMVATNGTKLSGLSSIIAAVRGGVTDFGEITVRSCVAPPSGLVSWWAAEGDVVDTISASSGGLYHGATFGAGEVGQAFSFDGLDDFVSTGMDYKNTIADTFTMEFWAFPKATRGNTAENKYGWAGVISGQRYAIFPSYGGAASSAYAGVGVSVGINGVSIFEHHSNYMPSPLVYNATLSGWTHIAVIYKNKQPSLYVNGILVRTGITSSFIVYPSAAFGEVGANYGPYSGLLDEISIYNRVLSDTEILSIYQAGESGIGKCAPSAQ
jgi:hypothetical protein